MLISAKEMKGIADAARTNNFVRRLKAQADKGCYSEEFSSLETIPSLNELKEKGYSVEKDKCGNVIVGWECD